MVDLDHLHSLMEAMSEEERLALGAAYDGLQAVVKYVEEALAEYHATADRKLGNDMLARAAGPQVLFLRFV